MSKTQIGCVALVGLTVFGFLGVNLWTELASSRALRRSAAALRSARSYRAVIDVERPKSKTQTLEVVCPDRYHLYASEPGSTKQVPGFEVIGIGDQTFTRSPGRPWSRGGSFEAVSFQFVPCPAGPHPREARDLAQVLERFAQDGSGRHDIPSPDERQLPCRSWTSHFPGFAGSVFGPTLFACIDPSTSLPTRVTLGGARWTYSAWNDAFSILAPTVGSDTMPAQ